MLIIPETATDIVNAAAQIAPNVEYFF